MKKLFPLLLILLSSCNPAFATQIVFPIIWGVNDQVTNVKLNSDNNAVSAVVNGNLDNGNMSSGFKLFQLVASLPSPGNQGAVDFLTSDNSLNLDNGSAWLKTVTPSGALAIGQIPLYNASWGLLSPGAQFLPLVSNGTSSLPSYQTLDLTHGVTNVLPTANGGTGGSNLFGVPSGVIVMWSGTIATIPSGWFLCDGTNSTPDLRNRFIVGANADASGIAKSTVTGSALQTSNGQLPSTTVTVTSNAGKGFFSTGGAAGTTGYVATTNSGAGSSADTISGTFGTSTLNVATFYALAYIMKS